MFVGRFVARFPLPAQGMSLADRQALQRKQQMKFLKEQGLINKESDLRGGAGGDAQSENSKSSRARVTAL